MTPLETLEAPFGGRIGYRVVGTAGRWTVLIHGWCGSAAVWDDIVPALAEDGRVLAVSLPGFGGMAPPPSGAETIGAMGAAVAHALDHLDVSGATLVGHSLGGPVATEVAIASPSRTGAVLGLDTLSDRTYYGRVPDHEIRRRCDDFLVDYPGRMRSMVDAIVHPTTRAALRRSITDAMLAAASPFFALHVRNDLLAWDVEQRWPLVTCAAILLNSPLLTRLAEADPIPCLATTPVDTYDSGHFPMLEAPNLLNEKMRSCRRQLQGS